MAPAPINTSTQATSVADILERVLDKGVVVAGDIRVKICDIELLTIQLRLVLCSVEKAREIGIDWWNSVPAQKAALEGGAEPPRLDTSDMAARLEKIEQTLARIAPPEAVRPAPAARDTRG